MSWSTADMQWIKIMNELFDLMFGGDFLQFKYVADGKMCTVAEASCPKFVYDHQVWECKFKEGKCMTGTEEYNRDRQTVRTLI